MFIGSNAAHATQTTTAEHEPHPGASPLQPIANGVGGDQQRNADAETLRRADRNELDNADDDHGSEAGEGANPSNHKQEGGHGVQQGLHP